MTRKDAELVAAAIAEVEQQTESVDLNGIGASTLRLVAATIGNAIKAQYPRFSVAQFEIDCMPISSERQKQAIMKAVERSR